jgi:hypothetical protein
MRLGALLVRDGRLTNAQVLAVVGQQARVGGRFGTVLVEMRLIDADTLTIYLGLQMGIPIATRAALDRAKRTALRVLPARDAERLLCLPLLIQDRQLIVAMRDPHDLVALDELAHLTGYRIIPRVAPEVRLHHYLEKYYGIPRPPRFRALGDLVIAGAPTGAHVIEPPPPPLPGLPPPFQSSTPVPLPVSASASSDDLVRQLERTPDDSVPVPMFFRRTHAVDVEAMARAAVAPPGNEPSPIPPVPGTLELDAALLRIRIASSRAEIADAMLAYARTLVDVGVLLIVRDELAFGWKGFGPELDRDRLETLLVPLDSSSLFRAALDAGDVFATSPPASTIHLHLLKVLRAPVPARAVVAPVFIRDRAVNLFYGQVQGERTLGEEAVAGLRRMCAAMANAYIRLIALLKQGA